MLYVRQVPADVGKPLGNKCTEIGMLGCVHPSVMLFKEYWCYVFAGVHHFGLYILFILFWQQHLLDQCIFDVC